MAHLNVVKKEPAPPPTDFGSVFRAAPGLYLLLLPDAPKYTVVTSSDAYNLATVTKCEDLAGQGIFDIFPYSPNERNAEHITNLRNSLEHVMRELKAHVMQMHKYEVPRSVAQGGGFDEKYWTPFNTPVFDKDGKIQYIIHRVEDVTERVRAERERDLFLNVATGLMVKAGFDGYFKYVNPAWEDALGWTPEELTAKPWADFLHPDDAVPTLEAFRRAFEGDDIAGLENRYRCKDGSYRSLLWKTKTVPEEQVVYCAATDITEIRQTEEKLLTSEKQFRELANNIPQMAWIADENGKVLWYNQRWYDYTGTDFEEMYEQGWGVLHHPDHAEGVKKRFRKALEVGLAWEDTFPIRCKSGEYNWFLSRAFPINENNGKITRWFGTNTDIETQKRAEGALREKDQRLRTALQAGQMGTWELNVGKTQLICSETCHANYGLRPDEELGYQKLITLVHPEDRERWKTVVSDAIEAARDFEMEYRTLWPDESVHWIYVRGSCTSAVNGRATMLSGVSVNITERKKLEVAAREAQESAEAANLAKSEFLANMSHEIRTPMNAVIGLSTILGKTEGLTGKQKEYIRTLQLAADALLGLINDLLDISKIEARSIELEHIPFSTKQLLGEIISMMSMRAKEKGLEFAVKGESNIHDIMIGDPMRVRQIIMNLCSNAIKFTDKGGVYITITHAASDIKGVDNVSFAITDTGIGIPNDKQETIFQKFIQADSSINRKYGGTGLGLAITKTLTEIMNGTIVIKSNPGSGSTFTVTLPLMVGEKTFSAELQPNKKEEKHAESGHRVLLVEDYAPNVLVAGSYLEIFGYQYDVVDNGYEAVEKAKSGKYLAVLMDVQMHGINGFEATKLIRAYEKQVGSERIPIIGMTAHALTGDKERCLAADMDDYLSKPYNPDELEQKLAAYTAAAVKAK